MVDDGFTAALKLWLIFLVVFFLLGYPAVFSIMLGAIAALAGKTIVTYWTTRDQTPPKAPTVEQTEEGPMGLQERTLLRRMQQERRNAILDKVFRRKQAPSFKSRRQPKE